MCWMITQHHPILCSQWRQLPLRFSSQEEAEQMQSTMEISAKAHLVSSPGSSLWALGSQLGEQVVPRPTLAHQDTCARSESDPSKHWAECTSLFHLTEDIGGLVASSSCQ